MKVFQKWKSYKQRQKKISWIECEENYIKNPNEDDNYLNFCKLKNFNP